MDVIRNCIEAARHISGSVVFPEGDDDRIVGAAHRLAEQGIARPVLLGEHSAIAAAVRRTGGSLDGIDVIDPRESDRIAEYATAYTTVRPKASLSAASRQLRKPLFYGGMMVACGDADAMLAGVANPTQRVVKAALLTVGTSPGVETPSSFFVMVLPDTGRAIVFSDCAINIEPDAEALADIALASARSAERVLRSVPHVRILVASSPFGVESPANERAERAAEIVRRRVPGLQVEAASGVDAADVVNVLIFPDLNAGNIAYKLTQYLARARAFGPFLQGFAKPISDLSRGATVDDIVASAAVMLAFAQRPER